MSTTNRPPGGSEPAGTGEGPHPGAGPHWPNDVTNLSQGDDSGGGGGVDPAALRAGHEPDAFAVGPIFAVPLAVIVTFVIAISVAVGGFWYLMSQDPNDPDAHPDALARGDVPLNERLARTDRAGMRDDPLREVDQPRLEPLKRLEANGKTTTRPELPTGNSPQIHPEEILPDRYPALQTAGWAEKDKVAYIPIAAAIRLAAGNPEMNKAMFPVRKDPSKPLPTVDRPSWVGAGRGNPPAAPKAEAKKETAPAPKEQPKTESPKTPEKK